MLRLLLRALFVAFVFGLFMSLARSFARLAGGRGAAGRVRPGTGGASGRGPNGRQPNRGQPDRRESIDRSSVIDVPFTEEGGPSGESPGPS